MYFKLPQFITMVMNVPPLWGHSGSTGSFLYYSEDLNLYMAGSINQVESRSKPFRLMLRVMKAIQSKMDEERARNQPLTTDRQQRRKEWPNKSI